MSTWSVSATSSARRASTRVRGAARPLHRGAHELVSPYKANLEKLASGDVIKVSEVVRDLWRRDQDRGLSAGEKRMLAKAKQILISELALAEKTDEEQAGRSRRGPRLLRPLPRPTRMMSRMTSFGPPDLARRDFTLELARVSCVLFVVVVHILMVGMESDPDGGFVASRPAEKEPWFAAATWVGQVMPLFFVARQLHFEPTGWRLLDASGR